MELTCLTRTAYSFITFFLAARPRGPFPSLKDTCVRSAEQMEDLQAQVNELLEKAMQQPGVAEVTQLYETQRAAMDAHAQAQQAMAPRWVVFSSTSSSQRAL